MHRCSLVAMAVLLAAGGVAPAWWVKGHEAIAVAAAAGLPDDVPAFFRAGTRALANGAGDPDRWKNPDCRHLRDAEAPDHFLDLENFGGRELPANRFKAIALLLEIKQDPEHTGMLPYAIVENYERLCCAFYDYRRDPENPVLRAKCLVYAGVLAHFTGDCAMPLHTTRDYDGRLKEGKMTQKGIHARIDGFPEKNDFTPELIGRGLKAKAIDDVWVHALKAIHESHTHVGRCYELDQGGAFDRPTDESRKFILERCQVGAQLTMDLWYSAWLKSAKMRAPY